MSADSGFKTGHFAKDRVAGIAKPFCPISAHHRIEDVDLAALWAAGKRVILLDLDNTLTTWKSESFEPSVEAWISAAKGQGFELALISNSIRGERSQRVGERFGVPVFRGRFKPSRQSFLKALAHFGVSAGECVMIGDQLITDVLGATRTGIEAIWIQRRGEAEFSGTAIHRWLERRLTPALYRAILPLESLPGVAPLEPSLADVETEAPPTVQRQILRFIAVGGTVWVLNTALAMGFEHVRLGSSSLSESLGGWMGQTIPASLRWSSEPAVLARPVLWWAAALIAMMFSFWLNRTWTFGVKGRELAMRQLQRFYLVSIIGTVFNTVIATWFKEAAGLHGTFATAGAQAFSAFIVAFWNFFGQRLYVFREK